VVVQELQDIAHSWHRKIVDLLVYVGRLSVLRNDVADEPRPRRVPLVRDAIT
jgi:hypothetical protein